MNEILRAKYADTLAEFMSCDLEKSSNLIKLGEYFFDIGHFIVLHNQKSHNPTIENLNNAAIHFTYTINLCKQALKYSTSTSEIEKAEQLGLYANLNLLHLHRQILELIESDHSSLILERALVEDIDILSRKNQISDLRAITEQKILDIEDYYKDPKDKNSYIQDSLNLSEKITFTIKSYMTQLIHDAISMIGHPPCRFTFLGLGSMSMRHITTYSDLEFAILIETNETEFIRYFKNLSQYIHYKIICLCETTIPMNLYNINLDELTNKGINFDLGGKTPLGRKDKDYQLICTVDQMLKYFQDKYEAQEEKRDSKLPLILENSCYIYSSEGSYETSLLREYQYKIVEYMETIGPSGLKNSVSRAMKILMGTNTSEEIRRDFVATGDLLHFSFHKYDREGQIFDVKQEIYRALDRFIYDLGLIAGIYPDQNGLSGADIVRSLHTKDLITLDARQNLIEALVYANTLRVRTYSYFKKQKESMDLAPKEDVPLFGTPNFRISANEIGEYGPFFRYFYTILPLTQELSNICKLHKTAEPDSINLSSLSKLRFFDDSKTNKARIALRLSMYKTALEYELSNLDDLSASSDKDNVSLIATSYSTIATIYMKLKNYSLFKEYSLKALHIALRNSTENDMNLTTYQNNLGLAYFLNGEYSDAITIHHKSLEAKKVLYGNRHYETLNSYINLGNTYEGLGNHREALEYTKLALEICHNIFDKNNLHEAYCYSNLALNSLALGKYSAALEYYDKSLAIMLSIFGSNHEKTANVYDSIGTVYAEMGKHIVAISYLEKALYIRKKIFGKVSHDVALSYCNIGALELMFGNIESALKCQTKALSIKTNIASSEDIHSAAIYDNLGSIYRQMGELDTSLAYYTRAFSIRITLHGENHANTAKSYNYIGTVYAQLGQHDKALLYKHKALDIRLALLGEEHPATASSYETMAHSFKEKLRYEEALKYQKLSVMSKEKIYGENHISTASSYINLSIIFEKLGDYTNELKYKLKNLAILEKLCKKTDIKVISAYNQIGSTYSALDKHIHAMEYFQNAYKLANNSLEIDQKIIASICNNIAYTSEILGDINGALEFYRKALEIRIDNDDEINTIAINRFYIAEQLIALGRYSEALIELREAIGTLRLYHSTFEQTVFLQVNSTYMALNDTMSSQEDEVTKMEDRLVVLEHDEQNTNMEIFSLLALCQVSD